MLQIEYGTPLVKLFNMHIGFITPEYPHSDLPGAGGLGTSIKNLADNLINENIKVSVFVLGASIEKDFIENNIHFYFLKTSRFPGITWYVARIQFQNTINTIVNKKNIDLLEAPDWTGITAFMSFDVPLIIRCNGSDAYFCNLEKRKQKWKNRWFEKNALNKADAIISASSFTGKKTKEIFRLKKDIQTIYNGVNTNIFKPILAEVVSHSVLYFGTIIRKKGVLELAYSFNHLKKSMPNAVLTLLGKDSIDVLKNRSTLEMVMELIDKQYWKDVIYLDEVPYNMVSQQIAQAEVVVLPSFAEAFPMTWLEAMAMEKALVTSNIGWANEMMINGETGYMIDPKDHIDFASKIQLLLSDSKLRNKMGKKAREHVKQLFSSESLIKRNIEYYNTII